MVQRTSLLSWSAAATCSVPLLAAEPLAETTMHKVPAPAGWVVTPDNLTLIISQPKTAELLYFDTAEETLEKQIELEFAPGVMLLKDAALYVAGDGSGIVYVLDPETGKQRKRITVRGNEITDLAGAPNDPYVYAATRTYDVFSINTETGQATKTEGIGNLVEVDSKKPSRVYTGVKRNDTRDVFIIKAGRRGEIRIIWDQWGPRSGILSYDAKDGKLKLDDVQENATVNGYSMLLSPDGEKIMMTGGGGWRPPTDVSGGGGYYTAVFATDKLETMVGKAPSGSNLAIHPVLKIGIANSVGRDLKIFDSRSYVERQNIHLADGADMRPLLLTFVAKGTKIAVWNGDNPQNPREGLHFVSLDLKPADRQLLEKTYGKLPEAQKIAARTEFPTLRPAPMPSKTPVPTPSSKTPDSPKAKMEKEDISGLLAFAGFNDRRGLGTERTRKAPYSMGISNGAGGSGEPGWSGPWPALSQANFQKKTVQEGDAAVHMSGTGNFARGFVRPLTGTVEIEQYIKIPPAGNLTCYVWEKNHISCGPMWRVMKGTIEALDGDERGNRYSLWKRQDRQRC